MSYRKHKPEWAPENADSAFACQVMTGVEGGHDGMPGGGSAEPAPPPARRRNLSVDEYVEGVLAGNRMILSRAITLVESNAAPHMEKAQQVLKELLPYTGKALRVGITGVPGAGKSTFIEALGTRLCQDGHKVAVLAVDPSSSVTKGSILGDKTRMETLSRQPRAFIRPSPAGGTLGGVARKSRETLLLCEAAGYDVILVETVGVGQSETTVRSMVDFFLLMVLTGAGDELQGMKKGVMELADAILINKADGDNAQRAMVAKEDYERMLHYLRPATEGWQTHAYTCSAASGAGIDSFWNTVKAFQANTEQSGIFMQRRRQQTLSWVYSMVDEHLHSLFFQNQNVMACREAVEREVVQGKISATMAVQQLIQAFARTKG
ncbi:MAG TPA: methylmalonyl Co-A mutase-associated GTPase MeaB [Selenomonadales bacterium]|nr:methylmalonyl Co-A mutase-associated GTPase MeaB [Selenomonadales bacterium]